MGVYDRAAATAVRLIDRYGRAVTLRSIAPGTYNTATGVATTTPTNVSRNGALLPFGTGQTTERGNLILAGDQRLLLEPGIVPKPEDRIVVGSDIYEIVSFVELNPAGTSVYFDLHLRK